MRTDEPEPPYPATETAKSPSPPRQKGEEAGGGGVGGVYGGGGGVGYPEKKPSRTQKQREERRPTMRAGDRKPVVLRVNKRRIHGRNVTMRTLKHTL